MCSSRCLASVTVMIASSFVLRRTSSSAKNVCARRAGAGNRAADAAIVPLENLFVRIDDEIVVDTDLSEFVHDHGKPLAMRFRKNAVQQRRLAGAEIAGQNRDGSPGCSIGHGAIPLALRRQQRFSPYRVGTAI